MHTAKWIWQRSENQENTWMCFAKDVALENPRGPWILRIAADTKYWLYINGQTAVREGGLKRGRSPASTYFDEVDISTFLEDGINRIAVLVWYMGKNGFSHLSSGRGGLYIETVSPDGNALVSDAGWKVRKHPAYLQVPEGEEGPNFRLPEPDIWYDASRDMMPWKEKGTDLSGWDSADVWSDEEAKAFGTPVRRPIPFFRFGNLTSFVNSEEVQGLKTDRDITLAMHLPSNLQFTPWLRLEAPAGKRIIIRTETYETANAPGVNGLRSVYITKDGLQEYESLGWLNGQTALFQLPAGITVHALKYRETEYAVNRAGSFRCEDPFWNRLWEKAYHTLHLCMRDTFMDCPNRERAQWWGDADTEMQMALYCMDTSAHALYENGVYTMVSWYEETGSMLTVVPCGNARFELPFQNLAGIRGFMTYYRHTGRRDLIEKAYPMAKQYVLQYRTDDRGLAVHRTGSWDWPDWGDNADIVIMENAWLCLAMDACAGMAEVLEKTQDAEDLRKRADRIRLAVRSLTRADGVFYHHTQNGEPDDRANALAVLAGCANQENMDSIAGGLESTENASPYMEKTVLEALCEMNRADAAMKRMRRRYAAMTEDDSSALWELWTPEASQNHGWSGGPLIILSRYIAGIRLEGDGRSCTIAPNPCGLKHIECVCPTRFGPLTVKMDQEPSGKRLEVIRPREMTAEVLVPGGEDENKWNIVSRSM